MDRPLGDEPDGSAVKIRPYPHPYKTMLAISTDIDRTTIAGFRAIHRFCNTREETEMGPGLGLDIANSFWVFGPPAGVALFKSQDLKDPTPCHDEVIHYLRCGWIDTLHSYGNFSAKAPFARGNAEAALDYLVRQNLKISTWTNHGSVHNTQNLGNRDDPSQRGDIPGTAAYHIDLLLAYGTWIVWRQASAETIESEIAPFVMQDDKHRMWAFTRTQTKHYEPLHDGSAAEMGLQSFPGGRIMSWQPQFLPLQLARRHLDHLVATGRPSVLGQHLGSQHPLRRFGPETLAALRDLAARQEGGDILVTRTSRIVEYLAMRTHVQYRVEHVAGRTVIAVERIADPVRGDLPVTSFEMVRGLTFDVPDPARACIAVNGRLDETMLDRHGPRHGVGCIGVKWHGADHVNHAADFMRPASRKVFATGHALAETAGAVLSEIGESRLVTDPAIRSAIDIAAETYGQGLDAPIATVEGLGIARRTLPVIFESGIGELALACSLVALETTAIDASSARINLCRYLCRRMGVAESAIRFSVDDVRRSSLAENHYHQVLCHGLLEGGSHEAIIAEANRVLRNFGNLHAATRGGGAYLSALAEAAAESDWPGMRACIEALVAGAAYDAGIFHTPFSDSRCFNLAHLIGLGEAYGFFYNGRLGLRDCRFIGFPVGIDAHFRKLGGKRIEDEIRLTGAEHHLALAGRCVALGAPEAALRLLDASKLPPSQVAVRLCRLRALIKAGRAADVKEAASEIARLGHDDAPCVAALLQIDRGRFGEALALLGSREESEGEAGYLVALCHLGMGQPSAARAVFSQRLSRGTPKIPDFVGLFASALVADDAVAAKIDLRRFVSWRRDCHPAAAAECDAVLARLA